jgi:hypothetical protein
MLHTREWKKRTAATRLQLLREIKIAAAGKRERKRNVVGLAANRPCKIGIVGNFLLLSLSLSLFLSYVNCLCGVP